ncbi:ABC-2 type transport system ATP-binding protein [Agromyces ramosus]|uniref:ABC-2 type transport system ATP-binding protein n=1 Tax=Agromyces ramosus TaxID=33879 RepID=A0A4Q7MCR9_9MICO|nr:ABC-2 type transport system ATP-binding protein [Agromyces ramosus]
MTPESAQKPARKPRPARSTAAKAASGAAEPKPKPTPADESETPASKRTAASRAASSKAASARGESARTARAARTSASSTPAARSRAAAAATTKRQSQRVAASTTTETTAAERASRKPAPESQLQPEPTAVADAPVASAAPAALAARAAAAPAASAAEVDEITRERPERNTTSTAVRAAAAVAAAAIADDAIAEPPSTASRSAAAESAPDVAPAAGAAVVEHQVGAPVDPPVETTTLDEALADAAGVEVAGVDAPEEYVAAPPVEESAGEVVTAPPVAAAEAEATLVLPVVEPETADTEASVTQVLDATTDAPAGDQAVAVIPAPRQPTPRKKRTLRVARPAPGPDARRVLAIQGLVKRFGDNTAVDGISLEVRAGSFFGIVGPNGAGKTTTLSMVTGLLRPDAGTVRIHDIDAWADPRAAKQATGALPDRLRLFDRLTGAQLLYYSGALRGLDSRTVRDRSADLIAAFGLEDAVDRLVADYSAGMTKKIALACAMIHAPRLLVLDEPFESVDPVSAANLTEILERYVAGGGTVVLSSHGMDLIERVCDSAAIIVGGRVLAAGTLDEVRAGQTLEDRFVELAGGRKAAEGMEWLHSFSD